MGLKKEAEAFRECERLNEIARGKPALSPESVQSTKIFMEHAPRSFGDPAFFPRYSTDLAAAFEVVEKIKAIQPVDDVSTVFQMLYFADSQEWCAGFGDRELELSATAKQLPHAICRLALKAVGG